MKNSTWENKSVVIVEHEANNVGPGHVLESYFLKKNVRSLLYIGHPNLYIKKGFEKASRAVFHESGKADVYWKAPRFPFPEWALYIKDIILTLFWVLRRKHSVAVFVGLGNINALCGVALKRLGKVDKVVYYVIDYIPDRFRNRLLNIIYVWVERLAASWSDRTWNLSPRMIEARNARWNRKFSHQFVTPHGLYFDRKKLAAPSQIHSHELIYMGNLNEEQGIQLVIQALPDLLKTIPDIEFTLIGRGNYEEKLKKLTHKLNVSSRVHFLGSIPDNREMEIRLGKAAVAVAMYKPQHLFVSNTDPGKIKHYLSAGLPIIMTNMAQVADNINGFCGLVVPYERNAFVEGVIRLLKTRSLWKKYRANAVRLAKRYIWDDIFARALRGLVSG